MSCATESLTFLPQEKVHMSPMVLANISKLPSQHQDIILRIVTKVNYSLDTFGFVAGYCDHLFICYL